MNYEKKYKEALNLAKSYYEKEDGGANQFLDTIFPELKESEDERIRKWLYDYIERVGKTWGKPGPFDYTQILIWLERQKEQKPANIEELLQAEYERGWEEAIHQLPEEVDSQIWQIANNSAKTWEESFAILCATQKAYNKGKKDASKEQKPAEWSEEDCIKHRALIDTLRGETTCFTTNDFISWLKSLRSCPKSSDNWKPSEEQMYILNWVANILLNYDGIVEKEAAKKLQSLYNDLKKL